MSGTGTVLAEYCSFTGELLNTHHDTTHAAHTLGRKSDKRIRAALRGLRPTAHGRRWELKSTDPPSPLRRWPTSTNSDDILTQDVTFCAMITPERLSSSSTRRRCGCKAGQTAQLFSAADNWDETKG